MAAKIPVVATQVGGVPDVVSPAEASLVPSETPNALAEAVRAILTDRAAAAQRAEAAHRRLAQAFGVEPWLAAHLALYRSVGLR